MCRATSSTGYGSVTALVSRPVRRVDRVVAVVVVVAACACGVPAPLSLELKPLTGASIRALLSDSRVNTRMALVVRDASTWNDFWDTGIATSPGGVALGAEVPSVDFDAEILLISGAGIGADDREIEILGASAFADSVVVTVHVRHRARKKCGGGTLSAPIAIARVQRTASHVVFRHTWEDASCGRDPFDQSVWPGRRYPPPGSANRTSK